jgi:uracil-DNA glycosylase family 4
MNSIANKFFSECFVTSAVTCRPKIMTGDKEGEGRDPKWSELKACRGRLESVIYAVDPHIIIACGKFACSSLLLRNKDLPPRTGKMTSLFTITLKGNTCPVNYSVIPAPSIRTAKRVGDYDNPNGFVSSLGEALRSAWEISEGLEREDQWP